MKRPRKPIRRRSYRPWCEVLEDRVQPATFGIDLSPLGGALNLGSNPYVQDHAVGLAGANENPQNASPATGNETFAGITYNDTTNALTLQFAYGSDFGFVNLTGDFSLAHIHGPGPVLAPGSANMNGGILHDLGGFHGAGTSARTGSFFGIVTLSAAQETMLFDNELYINIHSSTFGGGEIRGQLIVVAELPGIIANNPNNGHYYELVESSRSWASAKAAAESRTHLGITGHLATIGGQAENDFLQNAFNDGQIHAAWIGLTDDEAFGGQESGGPANSGAPFWVWVTGEPVNYTNWIAGAPNNQFNEDYAEFVFDGNGVWNDLGTGASENRTRLHR